MINKDIKPGIGAFLLLALALSMATEARAQSDPCGGNYARLTISELSDIGRRVLRSANLRKIADESGERLVLYFDSADAGKTLTCFKIPVRSDATDAKVEEIRRAALLGLSLNLIFSNEILVNPIGGSNWYLNIGGWGVARP